MADVAQGDARPDQVDADAHAFVADARKPLGGNTRLADEEHLAGVAMEAVLDDRDVDIQGVAPLQHLVTRDAVAHDMVDGCADGLRKAPVVEGRRNGLLHVDDVIVADAVQLGSGDAGLNMRPDHLQHFSCEPAGNAHFLDFFGCFDGDWHLTV